MDKLKILGVYALLFVLSCSALGILLYLPESTLRPTFERILGTFELSSRAILITAAAAAVVFAVITLAYGAARLWHKFQHSAIDTTLHRLDIRDKEVDILAKSVIFQTAPAGHQVYQRDLLRDITHALHLEPGPINGVELPPTQDRLTRWQAYNLLYSNLKPTGSSPAGQLTGPARPRPLEPILPRLITAQRLIIAGGSDAGKTTLVKWIISGRADHSRIIVIDPHSPSKVLGFDVIGAGRDYGAIGDALESLVLLMTSRYEDVKAGLLGYGQHERVSVFIDEWTGIIRNVEAAGDQLAMLLTESRKVNIHLALCAHSTTIESLGLPDAQIRRSATVVEILGGNGEPRRGFIHPANKTTIDGKKATPVEYALPGPFTGFAQPAGEVVRVLPDSRVLKAQILASQGFSVTAIAREIFGVDKATGPQIQAVKDMLQTT